MDNILVATDGSEQSRKALETAADMAQALDATLIICHVLMHHRPPEELGRMAQVEHMVPEVTKKALPAGFEHASGTMVRVFENLDTRADAERVIGAIGDKLVHDAEADAKARGVKAVKGRIEDGDYADCIARVAKDEKVDLIVMGRRGLGPVKELLMGSVSRKVLHLTNCSVMLVK